MATWTVVFRVLRNGQSIGWLADTGDHETSELPRVGEVITFDDDHPFFRLIWLNHGAGAIVTQVRHQVKAEGGGVVLMADANAWPAASLRDFEAAAHWTPDVEGSPHRAGAVVDA